jgi:uncharacterized protein YyaL (SSP411 family)
VLLDRFYLPELGAMALVSETAEPLVFRPLSMFDNAVPGATGLGLMAFQRLAALTGDTRFERAAKEIVQRQSSGVSENPFGFGQLLCGIHDQALAPLQLVVVGDRHLPPTRALLQQARRVFEPRLLTVVYPSGYPFPDLAKSLVEGREHRPEPTAFLCRGATCLPPITDPAALFDALRAP